MIFNLKMPSNENNISQIIISDEKCEAPFMILELKDKEKADDYMLSMGMYVMMNRASVSDGYNIKLLNFTVSTEDRRKTKQSEKIIKVLDVMISKGQIPQLDKTRIVIISGNIVNALELMADKKKISEFTCKTMIFGDEDQKLVDFFKKNRDFVLNLQKDMTNASAKESDSVIPATNNNFFSESSASRSTTEASSQLSRNSTSTSTTSGYQSTTPPSEKIDSQTRKLS